MSVGWGFIYLDIQNVDTETGILDIYMESHSSCSYCLDPFGNINQLPSSWSWEIQSDYCENAFNFLSFQLDRKCTFSY